MICQKRAILGGLWSGRVVCAEAVAWCRFVVFSECVSRNGFLSIMICSNRWHSHQAALRAAWWLCQLLEQMIMLRKALWLFANVCVCVCVCVRVWSTSLVVLRTGRSGRPSHWSMCVCECRRVGMPQSIASLTHARAQTFDALRSLSSTALKACGFHRAKALKALRFACSEALKAQRFACTEGLKAQWLA